MEQCRCDKWIGYLGSRELDKVLMIKAFGAFFAIMNPFVNLPIFLSLTIFTAIAVSQGYAKDPIRVALTATATRYRPVAMQPEQIMVRKQMLYRWHRGSLRGRLLTIIVIIPVAS